MSKHRKNMTKAERVWVRKDDKAQVENNKDREIEKQKEREQALKQPAWSAAKFGSRLLWAYWTRRADPEPSDYGWTFSEAEAEKEVTKLNGSLPQRLLPSAVGMLHNRIKSRK